MLSQERIKLLLQSSRAFDVETLTDSKAKIAALYIKRAATVATSRKKWAIEDLLNAQKYDPNNMTAQALLDALQCQNQDEDNKNIDVISDQMKPSKMSLVS